MISAAFILYILGLVYETKAGFPQPFPVNNPGIAFPPIIPVNPSFFPIPSPCQVKGAVLVGNKCVLVEPTQLSWNEANRYCSQLGYKLSEITTGQDYFDIISYLKSRGILNYSYWVGAAKNNNQFWSWISTGLPIHTTFWAVTFLNGKGIKEPIGDFYKTCGLLDVKRSHFLNTENCLAKHGFLCESSLGGDVPLTPAPRPYPWYPTFFEGSVDEPTDSPCPPGWIYYAGKCYYINKNESLHFMDAKNACNEKSASLVIIENKQECKFLETAVWKYANGDDDLELWIGLTSDMFGNFTWINGQPLNATCWHQDCPTSKNPSCGVLVHDDDDNNDDDEECKNWCNAECWETKGYICKKDSH